MRDFGGIGTSASLTLFRPSNARMRLATSLGLISITFLQSGCNAFNPLLNSIVIPPPDGGGGTLDVSNWKVVEIPVFDTTPGEPRIGVHDLKSATREVFPFPESLPYSMSAHDMSVNDDGVLAAAWEDEIVRLSILATGDFQAERVLFARGVAWSNEGDRLAVITFGEADALHLIVVDSDLETMMARDIELPNFRTTYAVSWAPDDARLAVSSGTTGAVIVDLLGDRIDRFSLMDVHFVGQNAIVGTELNDPGESRTTLRFGAVVLL